MKKPKRPKRHLMALLVRLECGHQAMLSTGRFRVGKATAAVLLGHYASKGVYCRDNAHEHSPQCAITEYLGTVRET